MLLHGTGGTDCDLIPLGHDLDPTASLLSPRGKELGEQAKLVADNPAVIVLPNAGHWILEEKPKETTDALLKFLDSGGK